MGVIKNKNFVYLKGPKGDKGDKGDPGSGIANGSGRIIYNSLTKTIGFNEEGLATTNFVTASINNLINGAPLVLDTLNEIAAAIDNNPNFVTTINSNINSKLSLTGGTLTGSLILNANPATGLGAATKQYVDSAVSNATLYSTDDLDEGENNLYFTQSKARSSISVTGDLSYNSSTGVISLTIPAGFSGNYNDLTNKPTIPAGLLDLNITDGSAGQVLTTNGEGDFTFTDIDNSSIDIIGEEIVFEGNPSIGGTSVTSFSTVAISGNYNDLTNKPSIPTAISELSNDSNFISSIAWVDVQNKPTFAEVATTGSYNNLSDKPSIPQDLAQLTDLTGIINNLRPGSYNDLTDKPNLIDVDTLKSIVAASTDFADFKTRISNL